MTAAQIVAGTNYLKFDFRNKCVPPVLLSFLNFYIIHVFSNTPHLLSVSFKMSYFRTKTVKHLWSRHAKYLLWVRLFIKQTTAMSSDSSLSAFSKNFQVKIESITIICSLREEPVKVS